MDPQNWQKVKSVIEEALDLDPTLRIDFLNRQSLSAEVREEVDSLLAYEDAAGDMMQLSAVEFSQGFLGDDPVRSGHLIGPYRTVSELGQGGMGSVFLAERIDGKFSQRVALKLLKREMNTASLRRRFEMEREILSRLEHPNIARLLDAGTTEDHIPYIAMEYVDGLPIDVYCAKVQAGLSERLQLFNKVCSAVYFAHRNLVVHRDLKPSNILVTHDGVPKLLDFGISKIVSKEFQDTATVTRLGVMTPSYASPEQLRSESVTTASDVYSLGVILYELLSGHRPFEDKEANIKEIFQAVLETDPPLPSTLAGTTTRSAAVPESQPSDAWAETLPIAIRHTAPQNVVIQSQYLRGDLDNIVLKALKKEPDRRYASPQSLAEDIDRHLNGMPVTARPDTLGYRAGKFVARNRMTVIAAGLIALTLIAGGVATLWQARVAHAERERAERRFADVRGLANSFLTEISPLIENLPGSTPARRLLVTRALEYLDKISAEAEGDLELQRELAIAYEKVGDVQGNPYNPNIGDVKGSLASYEKAVEIRDRLRTAGLIGDLDVEDALLFEKIGGLQANGGDYDQGIVFNEKALTLREAAVNADPGSYDARASLARALRSRGLIPFFEGDNKKALEYYRRASGIYEQLVTERPNDDHVGIDRAYIFVAMGEAYGWDTEYQLAAENLERGLGLVKQIAEKHPNNLSFQRTLNLAYNKRAENYEDTEQPAMAVETYAKGLEIAKRSSLADPENFQARRDVAMGYKKMAQALDSAGKSKESVENLTLALTAFQDLSSADPNNSEAAYDVANTRFSLGETYLTLKEHEKALDIFRTAKGEFEKVLAVNPNNVYAVRMSSYNLDRMGKCYVALAQKSDRETRLKAAVENFQTALDNLKKLRTLGKLGEFDVKELPGMEANLEKIRLEVSKLDA